MFVLVFFFFFTDPSYKYCAYANGVNVANMYRVTNKFLIYCELSEKRLTDRLFSDSFVLENAPYKSTRLVVT